MSEYSRRFVGSIPEHYDRGLGPVLMARFAELKAERVASFAPSRVLETACGAGVVTRLLRDRLQPDAAIVATDISSSMLEVARRKFSADENVTFEAQDATRLTFPDASFDVVVCQFGIMFFPDKDTGFREALRVLAPKGRYLFSVWDAIEFNPHARLMSETLIETFNFDPSPFLRVGFGSAAIEPIKASLLAAGFEAVRVDVARVDGSMADERAFAEGLVKGSPLAEQMAAQGVDPETLVSVVEDRLKREFGEKGSVPLQAIVYEACRA